MDFPINERLNDFFRGDDAAWEMIARHYRLPMLRALAPRFLGLSLYELEDVYADWFMDKWIKIREERNRADAEGLENKLSEQAISDKRFEYGAKRFGFDFERDFQGWLWICLKHAAIDYLRKKIRRNEVEPVSENSGKPNEDREETEEIEFQLWAKEFKNHLIAFLDKKERLYLQLWLDYGEHPPGNVVREALKLVFEKDDFSPATVTIIKQGFQRIIYLTKLRMESDAGQLQDYSRPPADSEKQEPNDEKIDKAYFEDMMRIIWKIFYDDHNSREKSRKEISRDLWFEWDRLVQRNHVQRDILVNGYWYFRRNNQRPAFCGVAEIYARDRFGRKVKELFFNNGQ